LDVPRKEGKGVRVAHTHENEKHGRSIHAGMILILILFSLLLPLLVRRFIGI
jgi:hypothetical protein